MSNYDDYKEHYELCEIPTCMLDKKLIKEYFIYHRKKILSYNHDGKVNKNYTRCISTISLLNFIVEKYYESSSLLYCNKHHVQDNPKYIYGLPTLPYCDKCNMQDDPKYISDLFEKYLTMSYLFYDSLLLGRRICKKQKCFSQHLFIYKERTIELASKIALINIL